MSKKTEALCTGTMLTVGFHSANPPLIWRFDLERNHSFTVALQGEEGDWELGVTSPKGDFYSVAHFLAREEAEEAFAKVEKSLSRKKTSGMKIALSLVGVIAFIIFATVAGFGYMVYSSSGQINQLSSMAYQNMQNATEGFPAQPSAPVREGVPMSADDILKAPQ